MALDPINSDYSNELSPLIKPKVNELGGMLPQVPQGNALPQTLQPLVKTPRMQREEQLQQKISQFENPNKPQGFWQNLAHVASKVGNIAGDIAIPSVMANLPGTDYNNALQHQNRVQQLTELQARDAQDSADTTETALKQAQTGEAQAKTKALQNPTDKPDAVEFQQTDHGLMRIDKITGAATPVTYNGQTLQPKATAEKDANLPQQYLDAISSGDMKKAAMIKQVIHDTSTQPKIDVHAGEGGGNAGTWALQEDSDGKPILFNGKTGEVRQAPPGLQKSGTFAKNAKPTADEQRRADLSENLNENLSTLEEIINRRPDLVGAIGGRWADVKNLVGSNDPDIGALKTAEHQIGMAQISAHGMKSAQGISGAADSIMNNLHSGPEALKGAIRTARNSVATFQNDVANKGKSAGSDNQSSGPKAGDVVDGYKFKGGAPHDKNNWVKQ